MPNKERGCIPAAYLRGWQQFPVVALTLSPSEINNDWPIVEPVIVTRIAVIPRNSTGIRIATPKVDFSMLHGNTFCQSIFVTTSLRSLIASPVN
jgi:hypothetical protein